MSSRTTSKPGSSGLQRSRPGNRRLIIAVGLLLAVTLGYIDRINMSVAAPHLIKEFDLTTGQFGLLTSVFNWAYIIVLIPVGILADKWGAKLILPIGILIWSIGAGFTGAAVGIVSLVIARLLLGAGESAVYPVGNTIVKAWAPAKERAFFTGALNAGSLIGPALGAVLCTYIIAAWGWHMSFITLGCAGAIFGIIWYFVYESPEKAKWLKPAERDFIIKNRETDSVSSDERKLGIPELLKKKSVWGLMVTQGCTVYTSYLFLTFLPLYLTSEKGLKEIGSGWFTGITYGVAAVGSILISIISDKMMKSTEMSTGGRRKNVAVVMLLGLPLLVLPWVDNLFLVIVVICWVLTTVISGMTLNFALAGDLVKAKSSSGRVFALTTFGGNAFGLVAPIATGYLVDLTGSYTLPFVVGGVLLLVGSLSTTLLSKKPIEADLVSAN